MRVSVGVRLAWTVACGCQAAQTMDTGPPWVHAESITVTRSDGATVRAARGEVLMDAGVTLADVEIALGHTRWRAREAQGRDHGAWFLSGVVGAWVAGGDGGARTDVEAALDGASPGVEVEAPRMHLDPRTGVATLEGGIRIRRGDMVLEAPRVRITSTPAGEITRAVADGPVNVRVGESSMATTGGVTLDAARRVLEVPGRVRVVRGPVILEGEGVTVELDSGAVEMRGVRGRWTLRSP